MRIRVLLTAFLFFLQARGVEATPPNVLLILADDLGINDLGCYGRTEHQTPHLDQLAASGVRFNSAYCGLSICSASRAALMTGKSPARLNLTTYLPGRPDAHTQKLLQVVIRQQLPLEEITLAERFEQLGYATGLFGKWHLGNAPFTPERQGFGTVLQTGGDSVPSATEGGKNEYAITRAAIEFMERHPRRPFFCYVAHHTPHIRLAARAELIEKYQGAFNPVYAAMLETLDDTVGMLLQSLKEQQLLDKTIVIFMSDNGGLHVFEGKDLPTHNSPYRAGKGYLYEGGLRVPCIFSWPGRFAPAVVETPIVNQDLTATLMELCGGIVSEELDGISIAPLLLKGIEPAPRQFPFHFPHYTNQGSRPAGALRDGHWKLIEYYDDNSLELYDLSQDPGERKNLAGEQPARAESLHQQFVSWRTSVGAHLNAPNPAYEPAAGRKIYHDFNSSLFTPPVDAQQGIRQQQAWRQLMNAAIRPGTGQSQSGER
ncbi:sulfatase [Planctomicrobium sp. SH664]|uniref:sulfatase n=1 Tax=Planctomicrobium sp. SH664 TaxID=3448125 RepID=UPI003F5B8CA5